jgi:hypothetical protein
MAHTGRPCERRWPADGWLARAAAALLAASFVGLSSCTVQQSAPEFPTYNIRVDTIAAPEAAPARTFFVLPGVEGVSERDLQFREFGAQVERALRYRGYRKMPKAEDSALIILLSYGIGAPRVEYDFISSPVFGQVPSGTSTTTGYVSTSPYGGPAGTTIASTTKQDTRLGVVGTSVHTRKTVEYDRFLALAAVKAERYRQTGEIEEAWRTTVTSTGSSDDLRRAIPVMLAGAMRRLGVDTHGKQRLEVWENHPRVLYVRGELSKSALRATGE